MEKKKINFAGPLCLLLAAVIWGISFVAQSEGASVGDFTFIGIRSLLASASIFVYILISSTFSKKKNTAEPKRRENKKVLWICGTVCGLALCAATNLQQIGIRLLPEGTSVGKAGFLTALYIVLVPILGIFLKKRISPLVWGAVAIAVCGLYLIAIPKGSALGGITSADILLIACALCFAVHITLCDLFAPKADPVKISCIQFLVCGIISCIFMFIFEDFDIHKILKMSIPILYSGVLSGGVAFTLQIIGQRFTPPALAAMLMSLESTFSVIADWIIRGNKMSARELIGCAVMFSAIILAQLPVSAKKKDNS